MCIREPEGDAYVYVCREMGSEGCVWMYVGRWDQRGVCVYVCREMGSDGCVCVYVCREMGMCECM